MIIIKLKGGMGNQMFQYALGRRLAHDRNTVLKLDIHSYENQPKAEAPRHYALYHFNVIENFASDEEIHKLKYHIGSLSKLRGFLQKKILRNFHVGFEPKVLESLDNVYLDGYWHSEEYFKSIEDTIRMEFTLKNPLSTEAEKIKEEMINSSHSMATVALHVRRGDFESNASSRKYHGLIPNEYYEAAIKIMREKLGNIILFIFSDDIEWVKENIPFSEEHIYVSRPSIYFHHEIELMRICSHQIIANSSFSWWGAWLNQNPDKIIIAPKRWLAKTGNDYYKELPDSWIKM